MAAQSAFPLVIMVGALSVAGYLTGNNYKKRQIVEHSEAWETGLRTIAGVLPPRTRINPFIAKPHPALKDREIPIYQSGALQSQIVPGGKLDPYANPYPTEEQFEAERQRLLALGGKKENIMYYNQEDMADIKKFNEQQEQQFQKVYKAVYRNDPMAEYYRVLAYAKLHPELTLDQDKLNKLYNDNKHNW